MDIKIRFKKFNGMCNAVRHHDSILFSTATEKNITVGYDINSSTFYPLILSLYSIILLMPFFEYFFLLFSKQNFRSPVAK